MALSTESSGDMDRSQTPGWGGVVYTHMFISRLKGRMVKHRNRKRSVHPLASLTSLLSRPTTPIANFQSKLKRKVPSIGSQLGPPSPTIKDSPFREKIYNLGISPPTPTAQEISGLNLTRKLAFGPWEDQMTRRSNLGRLQHFLKRRITMIVCILLCALLCSIVYVYTLNEYYLDRRLQQKFGWIRSSSPRP